ncbi:hypothetical protein GIB67_021806, partial [Kingdonia uniflora]
LTVAVIEAGMVGLVSVRDLQREGHRVVVFEKRTQLGGIWDYDPLVEIDPLGLDPGREIVHIMGFLDYPFPSSRNRDSSMYPKHKEVSTHKPNLCTIDALNISMLSHVRVQVKIGRLSNFFVYCNRILNVQGIERWPGEQIHSHNYRIPKPFRNKVGEILCCISPFSCLSNLA